MRLIMYMICAVIVVCDCLCCVCYDAAILWFCKTMRMLVWWCDCVKLSCLCRYVVFILMVAFFCGYVCCFVFRNVVWCCGFVWCAYDCVCMCLCCLWFCFLCMLIRIIVRCCDCVWRPYDMYVVNVWLCCMWNCKIMRLIASCCDLCTCHVLCVVYVCVSVLAYE